MPRNLFGDVVDPSVKMGNKSGYTVGLTMVLEFLAIVAIAVVPLMANNGMLPMPSGKTSYTNVMDIVVPAPPPPPRRTEATSPPEPNDPSVPPREVPPDITPEPPSDDREFERVTPDVGTIPGGGKPDVAPPPPPDPPTASKEPVRVGGEIMPPQKVKHVNPVYPPIAQSARVQGIVIIEATIGLDGRVQEARVLRSIPLLDSAALEAVREWQFTPTLLNKVPVPVVMTVTVQFSLQ